MQFDKDSAQRFVIDIVLVSYNSQDVLAGALTGLPKWANKIVVDNASSDASTEIAKENGAEVIILEKNLGFGTACNIGAHSGKSPFILFLNPDATIAPAALKALLDRLEEFPQCGAISPRIDDPNGEEYFHSQPQLVPSTISTKPPECAGPVAVLSGAVLLCRREAFEAVNGFDQEIFLFYEDDDLSLRIKQAGWTLMVDRSVRAIHLKGGSTKASWRLNAFKAYHNEISSFYVSRKYGVQRSLKKEAARSLRRLLLALLLFDYERSARNWGRLNGHFKLWKNNNY
ncbi:glycosyl transferase [Pseudovibrio japonicus]|uniref:Glycosyl transferase n=1 Tax=Pseudovibrio japonicus TaxID=366534 RepID=A0ABQ3DUN0_9HYPH|nr:glycosyltransferase family 2 protein [Pseudovibrio japonicus]GHB16994.1 glycosyl transferase [Pseudovibrio japonicus]